MSLTTDAATKTLTITSSNPGIAAGWTYLENGTLTLTNLADSVGIGTTSPHAKLGVIGNAIISGGLNLLGSGLTNAGAITGATGLTSTGTITFGSMSTGILHSNVSGVISSSAVNLESADVSGTLPVLSGGTGITSLNAGDLLVGASSSTLARLGLGGDGQVLTVSGSTIAWGALPSSSAPCPTCLINNPGSDQIITPSQSSATGLIIKQANGGSADVFKITDFSGGNSYVRINSSGALVIGNPTQNDVLSFSPAALGAASFTGTITNADLTATRTWTFPDQSGVVCTTAGNCSGTSSSLGGNGNTNYLSKWTGVYTLASSLLYDDGANVGIGTTNPAYKLDIAGTLHATGATTLGSTLNVVGATTLSTLGVTGDETVGGTMGITGGTTIGGNLTVSGTGISSFMGNVGVGTSAPGAKLHIAGTSDGKQFIVMGAVAQTANLMEWQNSSGTTLASVGSWGNITAPRLDTNYINVRNSAPTFSKVFYYDGTNTTYTDDTAASGNTGDADYIVISKTSDYFYVGLDSKFTTIYFNVNQYRYGGAPTLNAQYSAGSGVWNTLAITDGTTQLQNDGSITFSAPVNWVSDTVNGSQYYWVRLSLSVAPVYTVTANITVPHSTDIFTAYAENPDSTPALIIDKRGVVVAPYIQSSNQVLIGSTSRMNAYALVSTKSSLNLSETVTSGGYYGINALPYSSATNGDLTGMNLQALQKGTGTFNVLGAGIYGVAQNNSSTAKNISTLVGTRSYAFLVGDYSTATRLTGVWAEAQVGGGMIAATITKMEGLGADLQVGSGQVSITDAATVSVNAPTKAGTLTSGTRTNLYGILVKDHTVSGVSFSNVWNLYVEGSTKNYIGGNLGIGTTNPGAKLDVAGAMAINNNVFYGSRDSGGTIRNVLGYNSNNDIELRNETANRHIYLETNDGSANQTRLFISGVSGGLSVGSYARASNAAPTDGMIISGNVGIGTTSPNALLTVSGSSGINIVNGTQNETLTAGTNLLLVNGNAGQLMSLHYQSLQLGPWGQGVYTISPLTGGSGNSDRTGTDFAITGGKSTGIGASGNILFKTGLGGISGTTENVLSEQMRITASGNVGIGTTNPGAKLQSVGSQGTGSSNFVSTAGLFVSSGGSIGLAIGADGNVNRPYIQSGYANTPLNMMLNPYGGDVVIGATTDNGNAFQVTGGATITGNVGIGTTSPGYKLDVLGSNGVLAQLNNNINGSTWLRFSNTVGNWIMGTGTENGTSNQFGIRDTGLGQTRFVIDNSGNVGIGTTAPAQVLTVQRSSNIAGLRINGGSQATANLIEASYDNTTSHFIVDNGGDVLIAPPSNSNNLLTLTGNSNHTGNLIRFRDVSNNILGTFNPQGATNRVMFSLYNTLETTLTNYERLSIYPDATNNVFRLEAQNGGTGTLRNMVLQGGGGNVGIGTTGPIEKLDVNGKIAIENSGTAAADNSPFVFEMAADKLNAATTALYVYPRDSANHRIFLNNVAGTRAVYELNMTGLTSITGMPTVMDFKAGGSGSSMMMFGNDSIGSAIRRKTTIDDIEFLASSPTAGGGNFRWYTAPSYTNIAGATERMVLTNSGNVGIGTTSPGAKLSFGAFTGASMYVADWGASAAYGLGTNSSNFQAFMPTSAHFSFNVAGGLQTDGTNELMRITGGGNVGIGTTGPSFKLDVNGSANLSAGNAYWINSQLKFYLNGNGRAAMYNGAGTSLEYYNGSAVVEGLVLNSTGNVGIGTTSPGMQLDLGGFGSQISVGVSPNFVAGIKGNVNGSSGIQMYNANSGTNADFRFAVFNDARTNYISFVSPSDANNNTNFGFQRNTSDYIWNYALSGSPRNLTVGTFSAGDLIFGTNNAERVRILSTGNVGIGTTGPVNLLDIVKSQNTDTQIAITNADGGTLARSVLRIYNTVNDDASSIYMLAGGTGYTAIPSWQDSGVIGAGANLSGGLKLIGSGGGIKLSASSVTAGDMFINTNGNVGIGTTGPNVKLHIYEADNTDAFKITDSGATTDWLALSDLSLTMNRANGSNGKFNIITTNSGSWGANVDAGSIKFSPNNSTAVTITTAGNVGIGTTSPGTALTLGSGQISVPAGSNSAPSYSFSGDVTTGWYQSGAGTIYGSISGNNRFVMNSTSLNTYVNTLAVRSDTGMFGLGVGLDAGISRLAAGKIAVGNGTTGDYTGTLIAGNVGIGTTNPTAKLVVNGGQVNFNDVSANGRVKFLMGSEGSMSLYGGVGGLNTFIGADSASYFIGGNVGIGTTAPGYKLQVGMAGDGTEARANAWNSLSDSRFKDNITPISNALAKITLLNGVSFNWKSTGKISLGLIAQEVQTVFPELVSTDAKGVLSLNYDGLSGPIIQAIKEQQTQIDKIQQTQNTNAPSSTPSIDLKVLGALEANGAVSFKSTVDVAGQATFRALVEFFDTVVFHKDAKFLGTATFNKNTGGRATISIDTDHIDVVFSSPYSAAPIVTSSLMIADRSDKTFITDGSTAFITNVTEKGFSIYLPALAMRSYTYNWIALAVDAPTEVKSTSPLQKLLEQVAGAATSSAVIIATPSASLSPTPTATSSAGI